MRVQGFHGTTRARAETILAGSFRPSASPEAWLGTGIYFFEASPTLAWAYARVAVRREASLGNIAEPAILTTEIDLKDCLDLFDQELNREIRQLAGVMSAGGQLPVQHGLRLTTAGGSRVLIADVTDAQLEFRSNTADCAVMNAFWSYMKDHGGLEPRSIRAPFAFGKQLFLNSFLFDQTHVQIAVKDPLIMSGLELVT